MLSWTVLLLRNIFLCNVLWWLSVFFILSLLSRQKRVLFCSLHSPSTYVCISSISMYKWRQVLIKLCIPSHTYLFYPCSIIVLKFHCKNVKSGGDNKKMKWHFFTFSFKDWKLGEMFSPKNNLDELTSSSVVLKLFLPWKLLQWIKIHLHYNA
jgi:hypothetical protein